MDLSTLENEALDALDKAPTRSDLEALYAKYLGRKDGELTKNSPLVRVSLARRTENDRPQRQSHSFTYRRKIYLPSGYFQNEELSQKLSSDREDLTLPGRPFVRGSSHPIVTALRDICGIFESLGYHAVGGPEVESDFNNFTALNILPDHPARDMHDTFYLKAKDGTDKNAGDLLLRTHTSPIQVRFMKKNPPPVRIVGPGRVFRHEAEDATHGAIFHQVEGLSLGTDVSFSDLKSTLLHFAKSYFGPDQKIRLRPGYFPFVEPGAEVDILCFICHGVKTNTEGGPCSLCKATGWIEMLGAGMVHPQVLRNVGYNPEKVQGFAFGMGVERIVMARYGIRDIRYFHSGDLRFLEQFR